MVHKRFDEDGAVNVTDKPVPNNANSRLGVSGRDISKKRTWRQNKPPGKKTKTKSIRGQIRSTERFLKNKGAELPPGARKAKEDELKELVRLRDEHDRRETEKKVATQYRMVKFFERRKLQRQLEKITQRGDKPEDAEKKKQILRDIRYISEYPKDKKYIALFPSGGHTEQSRGRVDDMRKEIEGMTELKGSEHLAGAEGIGSDKKDMDGEDDFFLQDPSD